ncbi:hypothetical protein CCH79_00000064 [Gambusia affinis]|uniref:Usherin n=1 Tax=Gambusia affinis TaxID=33528 RepID=A0A315VW87_GAMAF|nr:hypothetical protein CCH79_00000064 [Gambusia affinis]
MRLQRRAASIPNTGRTTDLSTDSPSPTPPGGGGGVAGGDRAEGGRREHHVAQELWFIVVMAAIALLLLAVVLGVVLHRALNKPPLSRARPPLVALPMQKRSPMAVYPPSNSVLEILAAKCEPTGEIAAGEEEGVLSVNSLRRSISQVIDGKSLTGDDDVWDPNISAHDSGMVRDAKNFMDDEEFVDTIKGFSTVRKEHTMFTDTNL